MAWLTESGAFPDTLIDVQRRSDFDATLVFQDAESASSVARALAGEQVPTAMVAALETATSDDRTVDIRFTPVEEVSLVDLGGGHLTSCILHTGR